MDNRYAEWMISLDAVAEQVISGASETEPLFVVECGKKVNRAAESYARKAVLAASEKQLNNAEMVSFVENEIGALLDCIDDANHIYFKNGMKLGASLLLQLLGAWEEPAVVH